MKPQILRDLRFLFSLVVACGLAGVPGAGGSGRCVCRWAAARPRAVRAASFARRVASKPGQAPPPPTGTAADPSGALHPGGAVSLECGWVRRLEARPGLATTHGHRRLIPLLLVGVTGVSRVEFLGCSGACCYKRRQLDVFLCGLLFRCYKRRQSEGFFADNGGFWAWIDDVCHRGPREAI